MTYWDLVHLIGCDEMEFFRVNDHMVKCVISEEDMDEYDVSIEDFFTRSEHAMEFLHEVVQLASEEVGYRPQGPLTSLQIAPVKEHGLAIFLTEKPQFDLQSMIDALKTDAGIEITGDTVDQVINATEEEKAALLKKFIDNIHKEMEKSYAGAGIGTADNTGLANEIAAQKTRLTADGTRRIVSLDRKIFAFERPGDLLSYAKVVELPAAVGSSLYKDPDKGTYYLLIDRNEAEAETLAGVYLTAYEYGQFVSEKEEFALHLREHCECVISENAIEKLKGTE